MTELCLFWVRASCGSEASGAHGPLLVLFDRDICLVGSHTDVARAAAPPASGRESSVILSGFTAQEKIGHVAGEELVKCF